MDEWVVWFYVEPFTLHLNRNREEWVYVPHFQILKLLQVVRFNDISMAFRCPVQVPDTASVNSLYIILAVPISVLDTASVITPLGTLFFVISLDTKWKITLVQKSPTVVFHILKRQIQIMTYNEFDLLHVKSLQLSFLK